MTKLVELGYDIDEVFDTLVCHYDAYNTGASLASQMERDGLLVKVEKYPPYIGNAELTERGVDFIRLLMI